jgi:hypothetical protein
MSSGNFEKKWRKIWGKMEQYMARLIQTLEQRLPKTDNVAQGTHKVSVHEKQTSINKNILVGFDSNSGYVHGWFSKGIHFPKIDMRKFDGNDPITSMF